MEKSRQLMERACELQGWQRNMILALTLSELDQFQLQGVEEEIEEYEQLNKGDN